MLVFFLNSNSCLSQILLCDSILTLGGKASICGDFVFTYYSSLNGKDVTTGAINGYIDNFLQYRIRLDTIKNAKSIEYLGVEYVYIKNQYKLVIGCNYTSDSSYLDCRQDRARFQQMVGLYQTDHLNDRNSFKKMFSEKKKFEVNVDRSGKDISVLIKVILDTNVTDNNLPKPIKSIYKYKIDKKDYKVLNLKYYGDYKIDNVLFQDSSEMAFTYCNKTYHQEWEYVWAFKPYKKKIINTNIIPQDTISRFPDFNLMDTLKQLYRSINIKSRYTLVEFWYKGCFPCVKNIKKLDTIRASFDEQFLEVIGINDMDILDNETKRFLTKFNPKYTILFNGKYLRDDLRIIAHPSTYIYDNKTRKVIYYKKGTDENYTADIIEALQKEGKK